MAVAVAVSGERRDHRAHRRVVCHAPRSITAARARSSSICRRRNRAQGEVRLLAFEPADHTVVRSVGTGKFELTHRYATQRYVLPGSGIEVHRDDPDVSTIYTDRPLTATALSERLYGLRRGDDFRVRVESESEMRADAFRVWTTLRAYDDDDCFFTKAWDLMLPRDHV